MHLGIGCRLVLGNEKIMRKNCYVLFDYLQIIANICFKIFVSNISLQINIVEYIKIDYFIIGPYQKEYTMYISDKKKGGII